MSDEHGELVWCDPRPDPAAKSLVSYVLSVTHLHDDAKIGCDSAPFYNCLCSQDQLSRRHSAKRPQSPRWKRPPPERGHCSLAPLLPAKSDCTSTQRPPESFSISTDLDLLRCPLIFRLNTSCSFIMHRKAYRPQLDGTARNSGERWRASASRLAHSVTLSEASRSSWVVELASRGLCGTMTVLGSYETGQVSISKTRRKACATFVDRQYRCSESQA